MLKSTQTLPNGYTQVYSLDLTANKTMAIVLNLVGTGIVLLTLWSLTIFINRVRPELSNGTFVLSFNLSDLFLVILLIVINTIVHEIIHGVFFWLFTRSRPVFGLSFRYAYAAAPEWYIPMHQYWIIGLAPLLLIGLAGMLVLTFCSPTYLLPAAAVIAFNTGGAVGDMWIVYKLFRSSPTCLVNDTGHSIHFYQ